VRITIPQLEACAQIASHLFILDDSDTLTLTEWSDGTIELAHLDKDEHVIASLRLHPDATQAA
jgi:hypothetical protein